MADTPALSSYALCDVEDVAELLGYDDQQMARRERTIIRSINSASKAIKRRSQREFVSTEAEQDQERFFKIDQSDVTRRYVRVGDMQDTPTDVVLWTPDRDTSYDFDVDNDLLYLPEPPEPDFPFEVIQVKSLASNALNAGWWLAVTTDWGFPEIPDDIVQCAIGTACAWILNDVMKQSELARQQGRRVKFESLIPDEFLETVDSYRLYRVA